MPYESRPANVRKSCPMLRNSLTCHMPLTNGTVALLAELLGRLSSASDCQADLDIAIWWDLCSAAQGA